MNTITLDPVLDLTGAASLKQTLLEAGQARIDASAVQRVTTPCLQILLAAVKAGACIETPSQALRDAAITLDLASAMGLEP